MGAVRWDLSFFLSGFGLRQCWVGQKTQPDLPNAADEKPPPSEPIAVLKLGQPMETVACFLRL